MYESACVALSVTVGVLICVYLMGPDEIGGSFGKLRFWAKKHKAE
jgi:hypothetical protein